VSALTVSRVPGVGTATINALSAGRASGAPEGSATLVHTRSQELDYPAGDQNVYATYRGRGGIAIGTWARKLLFAARFGEKNLLLAHDLTAESRLMMYRAVGERIRQMAPFLSFDPDPYIVVTPDSRVHARVSSAKRESAQNLVFANGADVRLRLAFTRPGATWLRSGTPSKGRHDREVLA
jgi:hypothetical protein